MQSWNDRQLETLRQRYPEWDLWVVPVFMGPDTWCAKPKGTEIATINTHFPEELVEAIGEQSPRVAGLELMARLGRKYS